MADEPVFEVETIPLATEDGEQECAILDYFTFEGKKYAIVSPIEDDKISDNVEIFRYRENGENISFDIIDNKKTFNRIAEAYNRQLTAEGK